MVSPMGWVKVAAITEGTKVNQRKHTSIGGLAGHGELTAATLASASVPTCSAPSLCAHSICPSIHPLPSPPPRLP